MSFMVLLELKGAEAMHGFGPALLRRMAIGLVVLGRKNQMHDQR
jgi:hypothetical protein